MSKASSEATPFKGRLGARISPSNITSNSISQRTTRYDDAELQRRERLVECASIVRCALPKKPLKQAAVKAIAADISAKLAQAVGSKPADMPGDAAAAAAAKCRSWLDGSLLAEGRDEAKIYTAFSALLRYIAHNLELSSDSSIGLPNRVLLLAQADRKPKGSDESIRVDGSIISCSRAADAESLGSAEVQDIVIISEAKWLQSEHEQAYRQLIRYSRLLYAYQHNRRFAWGITVCGTVVRVVLFTHDFIFASASMDVRRSESRTEFIQFIVALSYCDESQLGFDTTITWCPTAQLWTIECSDFNSENGATVKYYARDPVLVAERKFGRHTRGFKASLDPSTVDTPDTFIKDAWPYASQELADTSRDELQIIRNIQDTLQARGESTAGCVTAVHGGIVKFDAGTGEMVNDSTNAIIDPVLREVATAISAKTAMSEANEDEAYGDGESKEADIRFRVHRRIAIQPVGRPLYTFDSPYALMIILADAMEAHTRILKTCGYLHRDLSINNIMGLVGQDGHVQGLLTDYDCTIKVGEARTLWPERTGTLPFMSISNLLGSPIERTELDDWESLLYIICWLGIHGISGVEQLRYQAEVKRMRKADPFYDIPMERWEIDTFEQVATAKKANLETIRTFEEKILNHFKTGDGYDMLKKLALALYQFLFENLYLPSVYHGVNKLRITEEPITKEQILMGVAIRTMVNPFEKRIEKKDIIVESLLEAMDFYKQKAEQAYKADAS
ncbi:hypothetical protein BX667DRAFT_538899 [Coemansia mojavensis]|nr:hypothetical protein BX667DRAFT_538899 [Coemansia mojavensis]